MLKNWIAYQDGLSFLDICINKGKYRRDENSLNYNLTTVTSYEIQDIIIRRVRKGQCFNTPYFGTREFPAIFYMAEDKDLVPADINKDFGLMLYDIDYTTQKSKPTYFHCIAKNGVIDLRNIEVLR